jgi:hypothetical protein
MRDSDVQFFAILKKGDKKQIPHPAERRRVRDDRFLRFLGSLLAALVTAPALDLLS